MPKVDQAIHDQRYVVIPRTLIFLFNESGQVLLIEGAKNKRLWAGQFNGLGGHVEPGEDVLTAANRELFEEAGLKDISLIFCGQIMIDVSDAKGVTLFVFYGECKKCPDSFSMKREGKMIWVDMERLPELPLVEDLEELLPEVLAARSGNSFFFGRYFYDNENQLQISFRRGLLFKKHQ